jgi:hypothetical protein
MKNWVDSFKIALIKEDDKTIGELLEEIPEFDDVEDMKVASNLIEEAIATFTKKRQETLNQMDYIKKSKKFLEEKELKQRERINLSL